MVSRVAPRRVGWGGLCAMARTLAQEPGEPPLQELADVEDVQEEEQIEQGQETIDEQQVQDVAEALAGADESADAEQGATTADGTASLSLHEVALLEQAAASTDVVAQAPQVNLTPEMVQQFLVQKHQEMLRVRAPTQEPHRRSCAGPPALVLSRFSWHLWVPKTFLQLCLPKPAMDFAVCCGCCR